MTINGQAPTSLLDSLLNAETARTEAGVALLKKAQDVQKQQGEALIEMLEQSSVPTQRLDTYA